MTRPLLSSTVRRLGRLPFRAGRPDDLLALAVGGDGTGWMIAGEGGRVLYVNAAAMGLLEIDVPTTPVSVAEFAADPEIGERLRRIERLAGGGGKGHEEVPLRIGDATRWLRISAASIKGAPRTVLWRIEDATAEHEMQAAIEAEQEKLIDFIDTAPVGFYSADRSGRFQFVNGTLAGWLGYSPEELVRGNLMVSDVIAPGPEQENVVEGTADPEEARLKGRDGQVLPVRITQNVVPSGEGGSWQSRSVVHDLTQELAWRKALSQAEAHFGHFFNFAPIGIVVVDDEYRVIEANVAFCAMLGGIADGGRGQELQSLVREADRPELAERLNTVTAQSGPFEVRLAGVPERVVQIYLSRLDPEVAGVSGLLLHLMDATEQKNLELQFAQSQKMQAVGQLAGGIAHDFNNLLTAMIGFCDLLLLRHPPGDQSFADVMQIKQNANRAANLVRQLLAFSRQQTLRPKVLELTDVLAELSNLLRRLMGETIELKLVHGRDIGLVKVDQGQIEQVVINLAVNARDAMAGGGTFTVRTANVTAEESTRLGHELLPPGEYVLIEMIDTGCGIPPENLSNIFEPFFTTKPVGAGTGLGLSTVYGIIKQTGGFIFPTSTVGRGTTFHIYLPRYRPTEEAVAEAESVEPQRAADLTGKGTVLLVEDEDAVRIFASRALTNKGYRVIEAASGDAALKKMQEHAGPVDVLISDVVMPNMDGPTLSRHVRALRPHIKIIFISGYAEDAFRRNLDRDVSFSFLPKPFSLKQLAGKVKEVLEQPEPAR